MSESRYQSLDIWRGVACLMVVLHHISLYLPLEDAGWPGVVRSVFYGTTVVPLGFLGVLLFFVISGYCITASCDRLRQAPSGGRSFLWRRFKRIYPPSWAAAGCLALALLLSQAWGWSPLTRPPAFFVGPGSLTIEQWIGNFTLTETWRPDVWGDSPTCFNPVTWSLCWEEQCYFACFLTLMLIPARFFKAGALIAACAAGLLVLSCGWPGLRHSFWIANAPRAWLWFTAGMCVYHATRPQREQRTKLRIVGALYSVAALTLILTATVLVDEESRRSVISVGICSVFAAFLVLLHPTDRRMVGARWLKPLYSLGAISYSLYLTHQPVCRVVSALLYRAGAWTPTRAVLITLPAGVLVSVGCAYVFYWLVERRFLNHPTGAPADTRAAHLPCLPGGVSAISRFVRTVHGRPSTGLTERQAGWSLLQARAWEAVEMPPLMFAVRAFRRLRGYARARRV